MSGKGSRIHPWAATDFIQPCKFSLIILNEEHILADMKVNDTSKTAMQNCSLSCHAHQQKLGPRGEGQQPVSVSHCISAETIDNLFGFELVSLLEGLLLLHLVESVLICFPDDKGEEDVADWEDFYLSLEGGNFILYLLGLNNNRGRTAVEVEEIRLL